MIEIDLYSDIGTKKDAVWMSMFGAEDLIFCADSLKQILKENSSDNELKINIHCDGGNVSEGLVIYDILRNSGKNIFCNIDGSCHSMAIVILLAAPKENRTSNQNATALIHRVRAVAWDSMTADEARTLANEIELEEDRIAGIYSDRIGKNKAACLALMKAEKFRSAQELLDLGFISKINIYNTNKFQKSMAKRTDKKNKLTLGQRIDNFFNSSGKALGVIVNYDYTDSEGNVLFSTEAEEDTLAVGDAVTLPGEETNGTFELPDGRIVTIVDNVVTEITEAPPADEEQTLEDLQAENALLRTELENAREIITELNNKVVSNFTPPGRTAKPGAKTNTTKSKEDYKADMAAGRANFRNGKPIKKD
jgi:ATP-dependent Clp protease protease subunit